MNSFYSEDEIQSIGFKSVGNDVKISRKCSIYSPERISIGSHVRIDDFCILSGTVTLGNFIHVSAGCMLFGGNDGVLIGDFVAVSSRTAIYAESDDYSGHCLTNPLIPKDYRNIIHGGVTIGKHVIIGSGCTILPGVIVGTGCAVGAMSLINCSLNEWGVYYGIPCRRMKERSKDLLRLEQKFLESYELL